MATRKRGEAETPERNSARSKGKEVRVRFLEAVSAVNGSYAAGDDPVVPAPVAAAWLAAGWVERLED